MASSLPRVTHLMSSRWTRLDPLNTFSVSQLTLLCRTFTGAKSFSPPQTIPHSWFSSLGNREFHWCAEEGHPQESRKFQASFSASSGSWTLCLMRGKPFCYINEFPAPWPPVQFDRRIYFVISYYFVLCKYKMFIGNVYSELYGQNESLHKSSSII